MKWVIINAVITWLIACVAVFLFVPEKFEGFLHPWLMAIAVAVTSTIKWHVMKRRRKFQLPSD